MDPLFDLDGRVAIVTGGMGQLGGQYAVVLMRRGANVIIFDIADSPIAANPALEKALSTSTIEVIKVDITDREAVVEAADKVNQSHGAPNVLINNAALDSPPDANSSDVGPFEDYSVSNFERVMDVNVTGTLICCQVVGAMMARSGRGSIINVSSIYGMLSPCQDIYDFRRRKGEIFYKPVAYSVSKSAILNMTRYLATYWASKGVRVNTITLGGIYNQQSQDFLDAYCSRVPIRRMAESTEANGAIVFLASDASSYMTGSNLVVDGGWSAW